MLIEDVEIEVNNLGKKGWELVSIENGWFWFKRPIR